MFVAVPQIDMNSSLCACLRSFFCYLRKLRKRVTRAVHLISQLAVRSSRNEPVAQFVRNHSEEELIQVRYAPTQRMSSTWWTDTTQHILRCCCVRMNSIVGSFVWFPDVGSYVLNARGVVSLLSFQTAMDDHHVTRKQRLKDVKAALRMLQVGALPVPTMVGIHPQPRFLTPTQLFIAPMYVCIVVLLAWVRCLSLQARR